MSFFGGGTDMEYFFQKYGGAVISTTFDKYCYVIVRRSEERRVGKESNAWRSRGAPGQ